MSFELSVDDIAYFRDRLTKARSSIAGQSEDQVIGVARQLAANVETKPVPAFVRNSFGKLKSLIDMLQDKEWRLEGEDRSRVLDALAYFADPDDMIPDKLPGIGYLDDAIMIELVSRELVPEFEAYAQFVAFREKRGNPAQLSGQREQLQRKMRRRRRAGFHGGQTKSPFSLL